MRSQPPRYQCPTTFADYFQKLNIVTNNDESPFTHRQAGRVAADPPLVDDPLNQGNDHTPNSAMLPSPCLPRTISSPTFTNEPITLSPAAMFLSKFNSPKSKAPLPDAEGQIVAGYEFGPVIGHGAYSTVRKAFSPGGGVAAVKIVLATVLSKQDNPTLVRQRLDHEALIWSSLCHEHILPLFSSVHTPYADFFFTIFCPAGSLFDILKRDGRPALEQGDAGMMFRQVVRGLRYLHQEVGLVHRDIKLENILVDEMGVCKIGDFGMSRKIGELDPDDQEEPIIPDEPRLKHKRSGLSKRPVKQGLHAHLSLIRHQQSRHRSSLPTNPSSAPAPTLVFQPGSLPYAAPELLSQRTVAEPLRPHPAQDIWALGVMLYALMTGKLPFSDSFEPRLQMKILTGVYEVPPGIGRGAERVLENCLQRSVHLRWTIDMVDDVAWGVGWGAEGDDVSVEPEPICSPYPKSRSPSPHSDVLWQQDELRPSHGAAQRRSEKRFERYSSRTSVLMDKSSKQRTSRSQSRHKRNPPRIHTSISFSPPVVASPSPQDMSPLLPLHSSDSERGRRPLIHSGSRSPSPSLVPVTPTDLPEDRFLDPVHVLDPKSSSDDPEETFSRGRKSFGQSGPTNQDRVYRKVSDSELDVLRDRGKGDGGRPSPHVDLPHTTHNQVHKGGRSRAASTPTFGLQHDDLPSQFLRMTGELKGSIRSQSSRGSGSRRR